MIQSLCNHEIKYIDYRNPTFLIIGAQKSGTTSLYYNLIQHPNIRAARKKEIHFFDDNQNYQKGLNWYLSFFPFVNLFRRMITGEASPRYFFMPFVPERVHHFFPEIKLILLLRNPVDRAYSQYQHNRRAGRIHVPFETALKVARAVEKKYSVIQPEDYENYQNYCDFSFLARGEYVVQLKRWLTLFSMEQFLILKSEDFFLNPCKVVQQVFSFLGVEPFDELKSIKKNSYQYSDMSSETRKILTDYFMPFNEALYKLLRRNFGWELES